MSETQSYECPVHKLQHEGVKREDFQLQFHSALLNVSMYTSMRLYKQVNTHCHCPSNYAVFDILLKEDSESRSKDPKHSTT
jgi:hypothetical protein